MRKILLVAERSIRTARGYVYFTIYVALSRASLPVQTGNSLSPKNYFQNAYGRYTKARISEFEDDSGLGCHVDEF